MSLKIPLSTPDALERDIMAAFATMPDNMSRNAFLRRLIRRGMIADGHELTEDPGAVPAWEWPEGRD